MFYFITNVVEENLPFYRFVQLRNLRNLLEKTKKCVNGEKIADRARSEYSQTYLEMLFRFVYAIKPKTVVELGTSIGLTTAYLATPDSEATIYTEEQNKEWTDFASMNFKKIGVKNIVQTNGDVWSRAESCDFLYISKSYPTEKILEAFQSAIAKKTNSFVAVISDICRSDERISVWEKMKREPSVRVSLEMHHYGLLFFDEKLQRETYNLFYIPPFFS